MCIVCGYTNFIIRFLVFTKYQFADAPINRVQIERATFRLFAIRSQCLVIQIVDEYLLNYIYPNFSFCFYPTYKNCVVPRTGACAMLFVACDPSVYSR